jgi:hypothetical protein
MLLQTLLRGSKEINMHEQCSLAVSVQGRTGTRRHDEMGHVGPQTRFGALAIPSGIVSTPTTPSLGYRI